MPDMNCHIYGYDKDSDAYEIIAACPDLERACEVASRMIKSGVEIRRSGNNEPFDWLVVTRPNDPYDQYKIFSAANPDGVKPPI